MQSLRVARNCRRAVDPTPELRDFDALTGLAVRDFFRHRLEQQWDLCRDGHRHLGLILVDFDKLRSFRAANHKHTVGAALSDAAEVVRLACRRRADLAGRVRSGEFAVLLSDVDCDGTRMMAERIRSGVAELNIARGANGQDGVLTVTVGAVCVVPPASHFPHTLMIACDHVLKDAKDEGGNCVGVRCRL